MLELIAKCSISLNVLYYSVYSVLSNTNFYLIVITCISVSMFLNVIRWRIKFIAYTLLVLLIALWGFLLGLDGIMFLFLTTEFALILFFCLIYATLYIKTFQPTAIPIYSLWIISLCSLLAYFEAYNSIFLISSYINVYMVTKLIVSVDFFILYKILFIYYPILTVLITLLITFISLFFILLYINFKNMKLQQIKLNTHFSFLRKQLLTRQVRYRVKVRVINN